MLLWGVQPDPSRPFFEKRLEIHGFLGYVRKIILTLFPVKKHQFSLQTSKKTAEAVFSNASMLKTKSV